MEKRSRWTRFVRSPATYVIAIFVAWWGFVAVSASRKVQLGAWDFSATGQLGDSFGIVSAFMATMAAIFTYQTLEHTRERAKKAEADAAKERRLADARDRERDAAEARRDSERAYFLLLEQRFRLLGDICVGFGSDKQVGTDGAKYLVDWIAKYNMNKKPGERKRFREIYLKTFDQNKNDLGHYFRFTYHIVGFANESFGDDAYRYVRFLRAQLSNAELVLIALNCAYGGGRKKFKPWVEKFALLHNMDPADRKRFNVDKLFHANAFGNAEDVDDSWGAPKSPPKRQDLT